jgi:uncharacterized protein
VESREPISPRALRAGMIPPRHRVEVPMAQHSCIDGRSGRPAIPTLPVDLFAIPLDAGRFVVYAPLVRSAFVTNARTVNVLADLKSGAIAPDDASIADIAGFITSIGLLAEQHAPAPVTTFDGDPSPTAVTLFLTTACNLRCKYCYAQAGDTPLKMMSLDVARRGIDFVAANALRKGQPGFEIAFHGGGEAAANWAVMTGAMAHARDVAARSGLSVSAAAASNGVLRDEQIDWFVASLSGASISLDGLPEVNDAYRVTATGRGSSERIAHALRRFDAAGFAYGIRMTVTRDAICRLPESIAYIGSNFTPRRVQVEPAYQLGRWADGPSAETAEFVEMYRAAAKVAREHGIEMMYSAARIDTLTNHFCGITQDAFALSPDGNVSACHEVFAEDRPQANVFFYGAPNASAAGYRFDMQRLAHLRRQGVENRDHCRGCFARWHCAGDCLHKANAENPSGGFAGTQRCHVTRELTKDQILDKIAASGGVCWHEPAAISTDGNGWLPAAGKEMLL